MWNGNCFEVVKITITASECYSTNFSFFVSLNNKLLLRNWRYRTIKDCGDRQKCDEIQHIHWMALIDGYWMVNNDWLSDIKWLNHLTCSSYSIRRKTPGNQANKSLGFTHSTTYATSYELKFVIFFVNKSWLT